MKKHKQCKCKCCCVPGCSVGLLPAAVAVLKRMVSVAPVVRVRTVVMLQLHSKNGL